MSTIRKATNDDITLINSLANVIFRHTYGPILEQEQVDFMFDMMYSPSAIEAQIIAGHEYFIIENDCEACGYLSIRKKGERFYYIEKIYTLPTIHGSGIGRTLFEFACRYAKESCEGKPTLLELNVNRYNGRAIKFYTKMGMRAARRTDNHVGNGYYANDYVMAIEL